MELLWCRFCSTVEAMTTAMLGLRQGTQREVSRDGAHTTHTASSFLSSFLSP